MKKSATVLLLLVCSLAFLDGQEPRFGQEPPKAKRGVDYPIKVHVSGIRLRTHCESILDRSFCTDVIYADANLNGQKIELMGDQFWFQGYPVPLIPGDYQVRLLKAHQATIGNQIGEKYELVFPDRFVWRCTVTGISE